MRELENTIASMKTLETEEGFDANDRVAVLRAKTSLIERWVSAKKDLFGVREMSEFQMVVLAAMEELLDVDGRAKFIEKLKGGK
jgi:hypothetical protein